MIKSFSLETGCMWNLIVKVKIKSPTTTLPLLPLVTNITTITCYCFITTPIQLFKVTTSFFLVVGPTLYFHSLSRFVYQISQKIQNICCVNRREKALCRCEIKAIVREKLGIAFAQDLCERWNIIKHWVLPLIKSISNSVTRFF